MEQTLQHEVEKLRTQYESWMGKDLLQKYHDVLMQVLQSKQEDKVNISPEMAMKYVAIQQEILRRLDGKQN